MGSIARDMELLVDQAYDLLQKDAEVDLRASLPTFLQHSEPYIELPPLVEAC